MGCITETSATDFRFPPARRLRIIVGVTATPFRHVHRVSYAECTIGNHIYYSRYLDLLETARGEFFRALGETLQSLQNQDAIFPVIEASLRYKSPARYDEVLEIEVRPTVAERIRLDFSYRIVRPADGRLILEAETRHVCTTVGEKPRRLPGGLAARLQPLLPTPAVAP